MKPDILWGERAPGDAFAVGDSPDGGGVAIYAEMPDWVRLPPELGGRAARVLIAREARCPAAGHDHRVRHLDLDGGLAVAECPAAGFLWYQRRGNP